MIRPLFQPEGGLALLLSIDGQRRAAFESFAERAGMMLEIVGSADFAMKRMTQSTYDLLLLDAPLMTPAFQRLLREGAPAARIIVMTPGVEAERILEWMRLGVDDLLVEPVTERDFVEALTRWRRTRPAPPSGCGRRGGAEGMRLVIGENPAMRRLIAQVEKAVRAATPLLLEGETGTGKTLIAKEIHRLSGRPGSLVTVNCAALSPALIESELFGHVKGAYTGANTNRTGLLASAKSGTLLLDEIGELPLNLQPKLLRALEEGVIRQVGSDAEVKINTRIVAATNRNLRRMVEKGDFRADLYYRLSVVRFLVPPLRERKDDIVRLLHRFIEEIALELGVESCEPDDLALSRLLRHPWPGNVRELRNHIERSLLLETPLGTGLVQEDDTETDLIDSTCLEEYEKRHILDVLSASGGNKSQAALLLGISRRTLERKLKRWQEVREGLWLLS